MILKGSCPRSVVASPTWSTRPLRPALPWRGGTSTRRGVSPSPSSRWVRREHANSTTSPTSTSSTSPRSGQMGTNEKPLRSRRALRRRRHPPARGPEPKRRCGRLMRTCGPRGATERSCAPSSPTASIGTSGRRCGSSRRCSRRAPVRGTRPSGVPLRKPHSPTCGALRRAKDSSRRRVRCAVASRTTSRVRTRRVSSSSGAAACVTSSSRFSCSSLFTVAPTRSCA